jgi:hypothetical protein
VFFFANRENSKISCDFFSFSQYRGEAGKKLFINKNNDEKMCEKKRKAGKKKFSHTQTKIFFRFFFSGFEKEKQISRRKKKIYQRKCVFSGQFFVFI